MTSMIDKIKTEGANQALRDAISKKLWDARQSIQRATYDNYKIFSDSLAAARASLDEAEMLFREIPEAKKNRKR